MLSPELHTMSSTAAKLSLLLACSLSACGAPKKAVPAEVELEWPDAAVGSHSVGKAPEAVVRSDAGTSSVND